MTARRKQVGAAPGAGPEGLFAPAGAVRCMTVKCGRAVKRMHKKLVRDAMTGTSFSVGVATPLTFAQEMFGRDLADSLAVVDREGALVGSVARDDLARLQAEPVRRRRPGRAGMRSLRISDVMSRPAMAVDAEASVLEAAHALVRCGITRLTVVDGARVPVGSVSALDLLRVFVHPAPKASRGPLDEVLGGPSSDGLSADAGDSAGPPCLAG